MLTRTPICFSLYDGGDKLCVVYGLDSEQFCWHVATIHPRAPHEITLDEASSIVPLKHDEVEAMTKDFSEAHKERIQALVQLLVVGSPVPPQASPLAALVAAMAHGKGEFVSDDGEEMVRQ